MSWSLSKNPLLLWALWHGLVICVPLEVIVETQAVFDIAPSTPLAQAVNGYLLRFVNLEASEENLSSAEAFLKACYFSADATCRYLHQNIGSKLSCAIKSKRIIEKIGISGLPASLLEDDLRRKLPIEVGHAIFVDAGMAEVIATVRSRVEAYLKRHGFYGATVSVFTKIANDSPTMAFTIEIEQGAFALVNEVRVVGEAPMKPRAIRRLFKRMCFRFDRAIHAISLGTASCYSKELERETIQGLQDRFAKEGYVQANIRVSHQWIDPNDQRAPKHCQTNATKDPQPRCVNLRLEIDQGPKFTWSVNVKDQMVISRNAFLRFLATLFEIDRLSRATTPNGNDQFAFDQVIVEQELLQKVSFVSARNADEQEIAESASEIQKFLVSKGYINAEVVPRVVREKSSAIEINFDVYAGLPYAVWSVKLLPEKYLRFITQEEIDALIGVRSFADNGHLSYDEIDAARDDIEKRLQANGFADARVVVDLDAHDIFGVAVTFYVHSAEREVVEEIVIKGGLPELNEAAVSTLANCDNYRKAKSRFHNQKLCNNSSLSRDKLDDDERRLADYYESNGFLYAEARALVTKRESGYIITFTVFDRRFGESSDRPLTRQKINDIMISGNQTTRTDVIKRLFPREGKSEGFDPRSLKKGIANMRESGAFSRIEHKVLFAEQDSDDAYFMMQVVEKPSLSIDTAIAFSTDQLFSLEGNLEETNLFSSMLRLNTSLGLGLFWGRHSILKNAFTWPFIFGKPLTLTIQAPTIVYDDRTHWSNPSRRLRSKLSFALNWRLSAKVTPYLRYWLQATQTQEPGSGLIIKPSIKERFATLDGLIPTLKMRPTIRGVLKPGILFANLDNSLEPHQGVDLNLWTEFSGGPFLGNPFFINVGTQNRFFVPLGPLTLALRASFMRAFIEPNLHNWKELRDYSEAMDSLGGERSIRGYAEGSIGIYELHGNLGPLAGYLANIASVELRFPLAAKTSLGGFSGSVFADQGMLIPCSSLFKCLDDRSLETMVTSHGFGLSVGAGLTWSLPVGPLTLDYAISPLTGENSFHFIFGFSF